LISISASGMQVAKLILPEWYLKLKSEWFKTDEHSGD
jgi:hypothetical protein